MDHEASEPYVLFGITVKETLKLLRPTLDEMRVRGWRTKVVVSPGGDEGHGSGVDVIELPMTRALSPSRDAFALGHWIKTLRRERPDVVVGSTPKAAMLSMTAARLTRVPSRVLLLRGARWDGMDGRRAELLRLADRWAVSQSTDVVAVSDSLADLFVVEGLCRRRPTVLGRGGSKGVNLELFRPREDAKRRQPTIGFVGRLSIDKGIRDLLDVFDACRLRLPDTRLLVVGDVDAAQPIGAELQKRLAGDGVEWLAHSTNIWEIMPSLDVLVFPSIREGLPNVVIEAAACGVPTAGYDTTGVRDTVIDEVTGRLVPLGDVQALAQATVEILTAPAGMGESARQFATQWFDQKKVVDMFADFIERSWRSTSRASL